MQRTIFLLVLAVVAGIAALAGPVQAGTGGAQVLPAQCAAEWNPATGNTFTYLWTPDTPPDVPLGISGYLPYTGANGAATFTPSGGFSVHCQSAGKPGGIPFWSTQWNHPSDCLLLRGPDVYHATYFAGSGRVVVAPNGQVSITCQGGIVTPG